MVFKGLALYIYSDTCVEKKIDMDSYRKDPSEFVEKVYFKYNLS